MTATPEAIATAAARLAEAHRTHTAVEPVRDILGTEDIDAAYAAQSANIATRLDHGAQIVGRKIGLTAKVVQEQFGVDQPDFGFLLDDMAVEDGADVSLAELIDPRAEGELAFTLKADLDGELTPERVRDAVEHVIASIEIVDSRINGRVSIVDTVSDNAAAALYVLGSERRTLAEVEPREVSMVMRVDGQVVSEGAGAACLGDPLTALMWLAETAQRYGSPLRAGMVVLSGALGPMVSAEPGQLVEVEITGLGTASCRFV
ncbi:MAG: fumarylacetoacetate hydrolase family protein [Micrococcales bacterium]|nr:fumarylacetoacetate hydrolase family protein [Micrococcales bacterium]